MTYETRNGTRKRCDVLWDAMGVCVLAIRNRMRMVRKDKRNETMKRSGALVWRVICPLFMQMGRRWVEFASGHRYAPRREEEAPSDTDLLQSSQKYHQTSSFSTFPDRLKAIS